MHEQALTEKILRLVLAEAQAHQASRITRIRIAVGELSGVVPESVDFYYQLIARGTIAAGAELEFHPVPAVLRCIHCETNFSKPPGDFRCPHCGNLGRLTGIGQECTVESIEVE